LKTIEICLIIPLTLISSVFKERKMQANKIQMRGHCQVCGGQQAVVRGGMSKHGYTVKQGWFEGVCTGEHQAPVEESREHLDLTCAKINEQVAKINARIENLRSGVEQPSELPIWNYRTGKYDMIPAAELSDLKRKDGLQTMIWRLESRAEAGCSHVKNLTTIADTFHGKPLIEVDVQANKPEPIVCGERRVNKCNRTLTCAQVDGARIYYTGLDYQGRPFKGWTGSRSWRAMSRA
jgi:hypothetical protein